MSKRAQDPQSVAESDHPAKNRKKTSEIDFDASAYQMLGEQLSPTLLDRVRRLGSVLGVVADASTLWVSFMTYLLILVVARSGLPEERFPIGAQDELRKSLNLPEGLWTDAFNRQDVLHAPARKRAPQAVEVYKLLLSCCGEASSLTSAQHLRLWRLWFHLLCVLIYVGDIWILNCCVFRDGLDDYVFKQCVWRYAQVGDAEILNVVKQRLTFLALTRKSINCRYNPRDGRRLTLLDGQAFLCPQEQEEEAAEDHHIDDHGPVAEPAVDDPSLTAVAKCPRIAFKSRWTDTLIACQDLWWLQTWACAQTFQNILEESADSVLDGLTEQLVKSFVALLVLGAPKLLQNPTYEQFAKMHIPSCKLKYRECSFPLAASNQPYPLLQAMLSSMGMNHTDGYSSRRSVLSLRSHAQSVKRFIAQA